MGKDFLKQGRELFWICGAMAGVDYLEGFPVAMPWFIC
jgi:hypothetical protein